MDVMYHFGNLCLHVRSSGMVFEGDDPQGPGRCNISCLRVFTEGNRVDSGDVEVFAQWTA